MAYKFQITGHYFQVQDTISGDFVINEVRDQVKWSINSDGNYIILANQLTPASESIPRTFYLVGDQVFDFAEIVDKTGVAFGSELLFQSWLSSWVGKICCNDTSIEVNSSNVGDIPCDITLEINLTDGTDPVEPLSVSLDGSIMTIEVAAGSVTQTGATPLKAGQIATYATGDNPSRGRDTSFYDLSWNNHFGNTNRFTDRLGLQLFVDNVMIDWSSYNPETGDFLEYYTQTVTYDSWLNCFATINAGTWAGTNDWMMINDRDIQALWDKDLSYADKWISFLSDWRTKNIWSSNTVDNYSGYVEIPTGAPNVGWQLVSKATTQYAAIVRVGNISEL